jgi:hypothetical protein
LTLCIIYIIEGKEHEINTSESFSVNGLL